MKVLVSQLNSQTLCDPLDRLRGSGARTLGVPLGGTRRVGGLLGVAGRLMEKLRHRGVEFHLPKVKATIFFRAPCHAPGPMPSASSELIKCNLCHKPSESACNAEDPGSIPGLGRSPGEGHGNQLEYSCLENSMDRGAWRATVRGVAKSQTRLSN